MPRQTFMKGLALAPDPKMRARFQFRIEDRKLAGDGIELLHLPGIPNPATLVRLQMAWPLERRSGAPRFGVMLGRWHDLATRR